MNLPTPSKLAADAFSLMDFSPASGSEEVLVNILVTEKCNFSCAHCAIRASPRSPSTCTTPEELRDILEFAHSIVGRCVRVNFVGGEPTLKPDVLRSLLEVVDADGAPMEMTSNGWWLREPNAFCSVMRVLAPYLADERLTLRISSSSWHDVFRKEEEGMLSTHQRFVWALEEGLPTLRDVVLTRWARSNTLACDACGGTLALEHDEWWCPACEQFSVADYDCTHPQISRIYEYAEVLRQGLQSNVRVDRQGGEQVTNNGRGADNQLGAVGGSCAWDEETVKFTFGPGGKVHDFCCSGGPSYGGHVRDGLKLLLRRTLLQQELHDEFPSVAGRSWRDNPAEFSRCDVCPSKSEAHFKRGSVWDKLVNRAYPLLMKRIEKANSLVEA